MATTECSTECETENFPGGSLIPGFSYLQGSPLGQNFISGGVPAQALPSETFVDDAIVIPNVFGVADVTIGVTGTTVNAYAVASPNTVLATTGPFAGYNLY